MKADCNHVQLALLHNLIKRFHCTNYLFVAIICFAELVNPHIHLHCLRDISLFPYTIPQIKMFLFVILGFGPVGYICL